LEVTIPRRSIKYLQPRSTITTWPRVTDLQSDVFIFAAPSLFGGFPDAEGSEVTAASNGVLGKRKSSQGIDKKDEVSAEKQPKRQYMCGDWLVY